MKTLTLVAATTVAVVLVARPTFGTPAECTSAQIKEMERHDEKAFKIACPSFFLEHAEEAAVPSNPTTFTNAALAMLAPCKATSCVATLAALAADMPACVHEAINVKFVFGVTAKVCAAFQDGPLTVERATAIWFEAATKEDMVPEGFDGTGVQTPTITTARPPNLTTEHEAAINTTRGDTNPSSLAPAPSTTPTSAAKNAVAVAGVVIVMTTTFVTLASILC